MFKIMIQLIQITMLLIPLNSAYSAEASFLKGNYAFTGVYNCLGAPNGGFDSIGQPVNESYSGLANITINGFMRFDGAGNSTQEGNFVEITSSAHPLNLSKPSVSSGTFSIAPSAYTISNKRDVLVTPGTTDVIALTGFDAGFTLIITTESGHLSGSFSPDKSIVLTTPVPLIQTLKVLFNGNEIITLTRQCSVTMTLIPSIEP